MTELYSIDFLIDKLYLELNQKSNKKIQLILEPPRVSSANKKTFVANFRKICQQLNREENQVQDYFETELRCKSSIDQNGCLIMVGNFKQNGIEHVFSQYVRNFVKCKECSSCQTILSKENRITYISCNGCLSKKALQI